MRFSHWPGVRDPGIDPGVRLPTRMETWVHSINCQDSDFLIFKLGSKSSSFKELGEGRWNNNMWTYFDTIKFSANVKYILHFKNLPTMPLGCVKHMHLCSNQPETPLSSGHVVEEQICGYFF